MTPAERSDEILGRRAEQELLAEGLRRAAGGGGGAFLLLGPGGMGKTRLLRWLEAAARTQGFEVRWGSALKEAIAPFFVFDQIFRPRDEGEPGPTPGGTPGEPGVARASAVVFEEDRPRHLARALGSLPPGAPGLWVTRQGERAGAGKEGAPAPGVPRLWITRIEGEGHLSPSNLEEIGQVLSERFHQHPGMTVGIDGIEYLVSQSSFANVLRLLQLLRDVAQSTDGHVLLSVNPASLARRELSLLEADFEVVRRRRDSDPSAGPPASDRPEPPSDRLLRYLRVLEQAQRERPQLLVLDDLHWADALSGTAFHFLCRNAGGLRVLLVAGAREEELPSLSSADRPLIDQLQALEREGTLRRLPLTSWGLSEGRGLLTTLVGAPLAPSGERALEALLHRTGGNPYFLRETLLQLQEEGTLRVGPDGVELPTDVGSGEGRAHLPASLLRLVARRLERLGPEERSFLETAALAGSEFDLVPVAEVLGVRLDVAEEQARRLAQLHRLLEPSVSAEGPSWSFTHPMVWEGTMGELAPGRRRERAGELLGWWATHRPEELGTLARLAYESRDPVRGLPWVSRALTDALERFAPESAFVYVTWKEELARQGRAPSPEEVRALVEEARKVAILGAARRVVPFLERLRDRWSDPQVRWFVRYAIASATEVFDAREAGLLADRLLEEMAASKETVPPLAYTAARVFRGFLWVQQYRFDETAEMIPPVLRGEFGEVDPAVRRSALLMLVLAETSRGHGPEATRWLHEAEELLRDDPQALGPLAQARAVLRGYAGDYDHAAQEYREASRLFRSVGRLSIALLNEYNAAECDLERGRLEPVGEAGLRLIDLGRKFELPRIQGLGHYLAARTAEAKGDLPTALQHVEEAARLARQQRRLEDESAVRCLRARLLAAQGKIAPALEEFAALEQEGAFRSLPSIVEFLPTLVLLQEKQGDLPAALEVANRVLAAAEKLGIPEALVQAKGQVLRLQGLRDARPASGPAGPGTPA